MDLVGGRRRALPEELPLPGPAVQISGLNMPCALLANGELHCLKGGRFVRSRAAPFTRVSIDYPHACAIANGRVLCADVPQYGSPQQWREPEGTSARTVCGPWWSPLAHVIIASDSTREVPPSVRP